MSLGSFLLSIVILLSPLYILRFYIPLVETDFLIPSTFLELLIIMTFVINLYEFIRDKKRLSELKTKFDLIILIIIVNAVIQVFLSYDFYGGLGILKAYFIEPVIFYYLLVFNIRKFGYKFILYSLIGSAFWLCLLALIQKVTGNYTLAPNEIILGRVTAVYNSANSLALYIGPIIILSLVFFMQAKKGLIKTFYLTLFSFFLLIMFWTKSRGGLSAELGALTIFTYTLAASKIKYLRKFWFAIPISVVFVVTLFLYQVYLDYNFIPADYGQPYTRGDTLQIRFFIWAGTINMLKDHPFFGAGLNGFKTLYSNQYRLAQFQEQFQYPHNFILTVWSELGILGLFGFLLLIVSGYSLILNHLTKNKNKILGAGLLGMLSYWMIHGVVDVPYFKNDLSLEFWIVVALIEGWFREKENI